VKATQAMIFRAPLSHSNLGEQKGTSLAGTAAYKQLTECFGLAWINVKCPPKPLYHSPSSTGQGRGNMMKGSRVKKRTGRDHSPVTAMDNTD